MLYKFDPYKFALQLCPPLLHSSVVLAILKAFCRSLRSVSEDLDVLHKQVQEDMRFLPSVLMLENVLNREFHLKENQIRITSVNKTDDVFLFYLLGPDSDYYYEHTYLFFVEEQQPVVYLRMANESLIGDEITIHIPDFLATSTNVEEDRYQGKNLSYINVVAEKYKPAGKKYVVEIYNYE